MIRAEFYLDREGLICGFCIRGHSGLAQSGSDVLCAFVSSGAYLAANTITDIIGADAAAEDRDGFMRVRVAPEDVPRCQEILAGLRLHLHETEKQYPENLKVILTEV